MERVDEESHFIIICELYSVVLWLKGTLDFILFLFFSPAAKYQECDMLLEKSDPMLGLL